MMFELRVAELAWIVLIEFATILFLIFAVLRVWAKNSALLGRIDVMEKAPIKLMLDEPGVIYSFRGKRFAVVERTLDREIRDRYAHLNRITLGVVFIELDTVTEEDLMTAGIVGQPYVNLSSDLC